MRVSQGDAVEEGGKDGKMTEEAEDERAKSR